MEEDYQNLKHYIENYDHATDVAMQEKFLNIFWDNFCRKRLKFLGISFSINSEKAKDKWAELDDLVRVKKRQKRVKS